MKTILSISNMCAQFASTDVVTYSPILKPNKSRHKHRKRKHNESII
jgi:hypothetical protein